MSVQVSTPQELQALAEQAANADGQLSTRIDGLASVVSGVGARVTALEEGGPTLPPDAPDLDTREPIPGLVLLDSFTGQTDDDKLAAAMTWVSGQAKKPKIGYSRRAPRFIRPIVPLSVGFAIGPAYDRPNEQTRSGNPYDAKIAVPASTANPLGSWLRIAAGQTHKADISGNYEGSGLKSSLMDTDTGGVLWTSVVHDLCATNFQHILGNDAHKFLITMTSLFGGHCNINNSLGCAVHVGGSDSKLFYGDRSNLDAKVGDAAGAGVKFHVWLDGLSKSNFHDPYITAEGGWGGIRVTGGASTFGLNILAPVVEGRNAGQPCTGTLISHESGQAKYRDVDVNYSLGVPMRVTGGIAKVYGMGYARANNVPETLAMIERTGGALRVRDAEGYGTWSGLPIVKGQANIDDSVRAA